ncbi:Serine carboxypeptidase-like 20 [Morus notabilis]|uniref:Serine carboxypeptidase-like 20 n=1 Tax=Morus notabilis TaxID=981085 RepID=W9S6Y7_9ROSA|nr:serine carboxypeptidase-like 20 [Morus notabilis]EXC29952.1 Serine carboxypeptidase-like 20 [Morus notabilis]
MGKPKFLFLFISLCSILFSSDASPPRSLVTQLPGFDGTFPSKHYSGYINIDGNPAGKNLFYYFVVSERSPATDPVVLWLNGGPGCSSFDGFVYEHGPFSFEEGKPKGSLPKLHLNAYTWTKVSNIIYLDSPVGVGFSYSKDPTKYKTGDQQTSADTHTFLLQWFEQFPEFISNPFYISGESFAGIYVPTLASQVAKGIKNGEKPVINFKGYMVGNAVTDPKFDGDALVPFAHGMALISDDIYEEARAACKGNYYSNSEKGHCNSKLVRVREALVGINIYDILEPCYHSPDADILNSKSANSSLPLSFQQLGMTKKPLPVRKRMFGRAWPFEAPVRDGLVPLWPQLAAGSRIHVPCFDDNVASTWLNDKAVREAIHAEPESVTGRWDLCTSRIQYYHDAGSMIPYHRNLTMQGYRVLVFSGDHDMCVPFTGSQAWTRSLGYQIVAEWRPWISNSQVAGYVQGYDHNLTFLTVKGAGHTVPEYKPGEALDFYSRWLEEKPI